MRDIFPVPSSNRPAEDGLRLVSYCPVCHHRYDPIEARIIDENDGAHLVHVRCQRCHSAILALILMNNFGISSVGLVTDLDSWEVSRLKSSVVDGDDLLGLYQLLQTDDFTI